MNRKAFNFYKSYYDVVLELPDKEKLPFLMAIFEMQFNGVEPKNLKGMAKFAFISQKHSLVKQLTGYKSGLLGGAPPKGTATIPPKGKPNQDKGEEEVQEEEQVQGEYSAIKIIGEGSDYFLVLPKTINSKKYRVQGADGLALFMEENQSVLKQPKKAVEFMKKFSGGHYNDFMHVFNSYNKFLENGNGNGFKGRTSETVSTFSGDYSSKL